MNSYRQPVLCLSSPRLSSTKTWKAPHCIFVGKTIAKQTVAIHTIIT